MSMNEALGRCAKSLLAALLCLIGTATAFASDTFVIGTSGAGTLTIPTLQIGSATYSNVVIGNVLVANIVAGPRGSLPYGSEDTYNPANQQLTIPTVLLNSSAFHNIVLQLGPSNTVSIGGVTGADTFVAHSGTLTVADVSAGIYDCNNVVIGVTPADQVLSIGFGLPTLAEDSFVIQSSTTGQLTIPAVVDGNTVITNVVASLSLSGLTPHCNLKTPASLLGTVTSAGSGASLTTSATLWNLTNLAAPTKVLTLSNPGGSAHITSLAIDAYSNAYYLTSTGAFYSCPASGFYQCAQVGSTVTNGGLLAVDGLGNAYVTGIASTNGAVVSFPVATGPVPLTGTPNVVYTSVSMPGVYSGLAVSPDGKTLYVGESGTLNTNATMHVCSIPCATPGGTNVTQQLLASLQGSFFFQGGLSGPVAFGADDVVYLGLNNAGDALPGQFTYIAEACTASGAIAAPTGYACTPAAGGGASGYPVVEGDLSPFALTPAIASDASGNAFVAADLTTFGGPALNPVPPTLSGFSGPSPLYKKGLNPFPITGPQGPAVGSSPVNFPLYALAATPPAAPVVFVVDSTDTLSSYDPAGNLLGRVALNAPVGALNGAGITVAQGIVYVTVGPAAGKISGGVIAFNASNLHPVGLGSDAFAGLVNPVGIAYDPVNAQFYVADRSGTVFAYDSAGSPLGEPPFDAATNLAYDAISNTLWLASDIGQSNSQGIHEFNADLSTAQTINSQTQFVPPAPFSAATDNPVAIAYCPNSGGGRVDLVIVGFAGFASGGGPVAASYSTTGAGFSGAFTGTTGNIHAMSCSSLGQVFVAADNGLLEYNITGSAIGPATGAFPGLTPPVYGVFTAY
jgi:hypothetical protein